MFHLQNKIAVISGGATLIGSAVARALMDAGASVALFDIDREAGLKAAAELGERAVFFHLDVTDDELIAHAVEEVRARFGGIDLLINLACTYSDQGFASTRQDWLHALDVNLVSAVALTQAVHQDLKARSGAIVNFASISAKCAQTGRWLYPVSKAAMVQLTRSMAMDPDRALALSGIKSRHGAVDSQHGHGPGSRRHPRQFGIAWLDVVAGDRRSQWRQS